MKTLLSALTLGVALATAPLALAAEGDSAAADTYTLPEMHVKAIQQLPIPTYTPVVQGISSDMVGASVRMTFRVNERGRARDVQSERPLFAIFNREESELACKMARSIESWKFEPALDANGQPTSVRVVLPVQVVEREGKAYALMSLQRYATGQNRS